jgi:hypothetical protein
LVCFFGSRDKFKALLTAISFRPTSIRRLDNHFGFSTLPFNFPPPRSFCNRATFSLQISLIRLYLALFRRHPSFFVISRRLPLSSAVFRRLPSSVSQSQTFPQSSASSQSLSDELIRTNAFNQFTIDLKPHFFKITQFWRHFCILLHSLPVGLLLVRLVTKPFSITF